jgi:hypothetical protein
MTMPATLPARVDGSDDPAARARAATIARRHTEAILDSMHELADLNLVRSAAVEVRAHTNASLLKLYILNDEEVFFGFCPVVQHSVRIEGAAVTIPDVMGKDSTLFNSTAKDDDYAGERLLSSNHDNGPTACGTRSRVDTSHD